MDKMHTFELIEIFQSTLPARGSDTAKKMRRKGELNFNPRSPQGGATYWHNRRYIAYTHFNPRSPQGGATTICGV